MKAAPFWSVMIPAYNPPEKYLREALESILAQDRGVDRMQIEVVNDHSPRVDVAALVSDIAGDRVTVSKTPKNLGLAGCWNTCVERARGEWVHILHQDDIVMPGFYEKLETLIVREPTSGMAFTNSGFIDLESKMYGTAAAQSEVPGLLPNWPARLAPWNVIQCAAVVVKRSTYDVLGTFDPSLGFILDWEMWMRIAAQFPVAYEPAVLAAWRTHDSAQTAQLRKTGKSWREWWDKQDRILQHVPEGQREKARAELQRRFVGFVRDELRSAYQQGHFDECRFILSEFRGPLFENDGVGLAGWRGRLLWKSLRHGSFLRPSTAT